MEAILKGIRQCNIVEIELDLPKRQKDHLLCPRSKMKQKWKEFKFHNYIRPGHICFPY